jgi:hypothetical protein
MTGDHHQDLLDPVTGPNSAHDGAPTNARAAMLAEVADAVIDAHHRLAAAVSA